jgi:hypothetical protein
MMEKEGIMAVAPVHRFLYIEVHFPIMMKKG